jgi:glycosyltransferase involved in cell wall biosynthesis
VNPPPVVSVVIPSYQNASTIGATVRSVLGQSLEDLELVVADHSSTDGTLDALAELAGDPRLRVVTTPAGGGAATNWNRATREGRAPYLKLVCADDLLHPTCLERQVAALEAHPSAGLAAARRTLIDARGDQLLAARGLGGMSGLVPGPLAIRTVARAGTNLLGEPACVLFRAEALARAGEWDDALPYFIDVDLYLRALRHCDLVAMPEVLASFRVSAQQWSARLVGQQASQARSFHTRLRETAPELVSARDARLGAARGSVAALQRRVAYALWRRRLVT